MALRVDREPEHASVGQPTPGYGGVLGRLTVSTLLPGTGLVLGGHPVAGWLVLVPLLCLALLAAGAVLVLPPSVVLGWSLDPQVLGWVVVGAMALAVVVLLVALASLRLLLPPTLSFARQVGAVLLVLVLSAAMVAPLLLVSRYAATQQDLVLSIFQDATAGPASLADGSDLPSTDPDPTAAPEVDPWAGQERVNVLLLGSDAGPGRVGVRPDTTVVASVDTASGDVVLISLPRNLLRVPFPPGTPLAERYPYGFVNGAELDSMLNGVYGAVPTLYPELFEGVRDPGAEAMRLAAEGVTGLPIDHYVMLNLAGFERFIDALGRLEMDVRYQIPIGSKPVGPGVCSTPTGTIEPGRQRLTGYEVLWYARARCGGTGVQDDYDRMRRQRCIIGAVIEQADPLTVLRQYEQIAAATKDIVSTDLPRDRLADVVELSLRAKDGRITSLPLTDRVITPYAADYDLIRALVSDALTTPARPARPGKGTGGGKDGEPPDESEGPQTLTSVC